MRSIARPFLAALLAVAASVPALSWAEEGVAPAARAPVKQPALKQAPAAQTRSAQGDCVREANRRGFAVLDTSNFQQFREGWSIDLRVRNQRGHVTNGSCFVETRTGDVNLYGFGWGYHRRRRRPHAVQLRFGRKEVPRVPAASERPRSAGEAVVRRALRRRPELGPARRSRLGCPWLPRQVRGHPRRLGWRWRWRRLFLDCNSDGDRYRECAIGAGNFGRLLRDNSNGRCRANSTWGTRNGVIWVTAGCRGRFERVRGNSGGSSGSSQARAEQACSNEVQRRGGRILQQDAAVTMPGGYRMQLRVRMPKGETRTVGCTYSSQGGQVRLDVLSGTWSGISGGRVPAVAATRPGWRARCRVTTLHRVRSCGHARRTAAPAAGWRP